MKHNSPFKPDINGVSVVARDTSSCFAAATAYNDGFVFKGFNGKLKQGRMSVYMIKMVNVNLIKKWKERKSLWLKEKWVCCEVEVGCEGSKISSWGCKTLNHNLRHIGFVMGMPLKQIWNNKRFAFYRLSSAGGNTKKPNENRKVAITLRIYKLPILLAFEGCLLWLCTNMFPKNLYSWCQYFECFRFHLQYVLLSPLLSSLYQSN